MSSPLPTRIPGNVIIDGTLYAGEFVLSAGCVADSHVSDVADISAAKLQHQHQVPYAQASAATAVAEARFVHRCRAVGEIIGFEAGNVIACIGDSTITIDLKKNGTTVLTAPLVITSALAARATLAATIDIAAKNCVADDVLEVVVAISAGTGTLGKGAFADVCVREKAG
ncbi:MAG: hypothetical protein K8U03_09220 [Planctomycetia bacterium]|nr:hypothetical protein [Planctomycetia bacterium]